MTESNLSNSIFSDASMQSDDDVLIVGVIRLLGMRMSKRGSVRVYTLELMDDNLVWFVTKRYSDFYKCHNKLVAKLGADELPVLPPKEPLLQRLFSDRSTRREFVGERQLQLQEYVDDLLQNSRCCRCKALQRFIMRPHVGMQLDFVEDGVTDDESDGITRTPRGESRASIASLFGARPSLNISMTPYAGNVACGVRRISQPAVGRQRIYAKLTDTPGEIDIVIHAAGSSASAELRQLRLTMYAVEFDANGEERRVQEQICDFDLPDVSESDFCEVHKRLKLDPGHLWSIVAQGFDVAGSLTGICSSLSLHVPKAGSQVVDSSQTDIDPLTGLSRLSSTSINGADEAAGGGLAAVADLGRKAFKAPEKEKFETAPSWAVRYR